MRILLLNQFYPPDTAATGQLLADVAHALARQGHEVHVLCSAGSYAGGRVAPSRSDRAAPGLHVHRVNAFAGGRVRAWERLAAWGSYYVLAGRLALRLGRFDACLALTTPPFIAAVGVALKRLRGTRLVLWLMDMWPEAAEQLGTIRPGGVLSRPLRAVARSIYANTDAIVSLGACMSRRLRELGVPADRIVLVDNWVPAESVRPSDANRARLPGAHGKFVVMYSGNMGLAHEFDTILAAAARLRDTPRITFYMVGQGKRRAEVEREAVGRGLGNITFMDPVPLDGLSDLLAAADVHLVSMREGVQGIVVPSKIYGILAAGRPAVMIGPRDSQVARLIQDSGAGHVVGVGGDARLAELLAALADPNAETLRLGRAARQYYESHLGRDRGVARIVSTLAVPRARPGARHV